MTEKLVSLGKNQPTHMRNVEELFKNNVGECSYLFYSHLHRDASGSYNDSGFILIRQHDRLDDVWWKCETIEIEYRSLSFTMIMIAILVLLCPCYYYYWYTTIIATSKYHLLTLILDSQSGLIDNYKNSQW